jgi:hypothetical protein
MSGPSAADGTFEIPGAPPNTYRVTAFTPDGTEFAVMSREITLKAGEVQQLEIRISGKGAAPGRTAAKKAGEKKTAEKKPVQAVEPTEESGKKKIVVIGIVLAGALAALAFSSGGGESTPPSPTIP